MMNINNCKYCNKKIRKVNGIYEDREYHLKCQKQLKNDIINIGKLFISFADENKDIKNQKN